MLAWRAESRAGESRVGAVGRSAGTSAWLGWRLASCKAWPVGGGWRVVDDAEPLRASAGAEERPQGTVQLVIGQRLGAADVVSAQSV